MKKVLITGGSGFIGSHVIDLFVKKYPEYHIFNLDAITYAADLKNNLESEGKDNYTFIRADITNKTFLNSLFEKHGFTHIIHLAAESHVDNSIKNPSIFAETNILGTLNLLSLAIEHKVQLFHHVSTDEVYGSLTFDDPGFTENTPYDPRSPYSASKAASDHFVRAYGHTFGLPYVITNCSNNYGPRQHDEKLIPTVIRKALEMKPIPVYGKGINVRDWLYVGDHADAIDTVFHQALTENSYNVGGGKEMTNLEIVNLIARKIDEKLGRYPGTTSKMIEFVTDRPGHDLRYSIDSSKIEKDLNWNPSHTFDTALDLTVDWYIDKYTK